MGKDDIGEDGGMGWEGKSGNKDIEKLWVAWRERGVVAVTKGVSAVQRETHEATYGWASCALSHSQSHHQTMSRHSTPHVSDILT
ncbi:unnamed protein product [Sphenostylis stenocarpa]|uniref:Uncharacterized protein n=1 Tax=Sphenostylis stenocarpa TaxID=92480 RepID=A0AA86SBG5_9FABA|nr:unnamed protein product [Sphenostylis stenocarpa]